MKSKRFQLKKTALRTTSAVLVFWLSSVLVLVCCSPQFFMASATPMDESCPMGKGHECCTKKSEANQFSPTEKDKADCCIFKPQRTLSTELQTVQIAKQIPTIEEKAQTPKPVYFVKNSYESPSIYHSAIRNRGSTYKQICVFRI